MAYDDTLIVDHIKQTHSTELLSEREKHLIGLAVTMTRGCQVCTRHRVEKARAIGLTDDELNALIAVTASVNRGSRPPRPAWRSACLSRSKLPNVAMSAHPAPGDRTSRQESTCHDK